MSLAGRPVPNVAQDLLWWLVPGKLGGMPMPFLHPERRTKLSGTPVQDYEDDLQLLTSLGIRGVACLLNVSSDKAIYNAAGMDFLCLPIADGTAPSSRQAQEFIRFVDAHWARTEAVAVHCAAGLGRTGTMLAAYLIAKGSSAQEAILTVRRAQRGAIETRRQVEFLHEFARETGLSNRS